MLCLAQFLPPKMRQVRQRAKNICCACAAFKYADWSELPRHHRVHCHSRFQRLVHQLLYLVLAMSKFLQYALLHSLTRRTPSLILKRHFFNIFLLFFKFHFGRIYIFLLLLVLFMIRRLTSSCECRKGRLESLGSLAATFVGS